MSISRLPHLTYLLILFCCSTKIRVISTPTSASFSCSAHTLVHALSSNGKSSAGASTELTVERQMPRTLLKIFYASCRTAISAGCCAWETWRNKFPSVKGWTSGGLLACYAYHARLVQQGVSIKPKGELLDLINLFRGETDTDRFARHMLAVSQQNLRPPILPCTCRWIRMGAPRCRVDHASRHA